MDKVVLLSTANRQKCFEHSEAVRKTALSKISIQTAHTLSSVKAEELDAKELFIKQVDSIALLDHISHELACLCRYKRKLEFAPTSAQTMRNRGNFCLVTTYNSA